MTNFIASQWGKYEWKKILPCLIYEITITLTTKVKKMENLQLNIFFAFRKYEIEFQQE